MHRRLRAVLAFSLALTVAVCALAIQVVYLVFNGPIDHPSLFVPTMASLAGYTLITNAGVSVDAVFAAFRARRELFSIQVLQAVAFLVLAVVLSFPLDDV